MKKYVFEVKEIIDDPEDPDVWVVFEGDDQVD